MWTDGALKLEVFEILFIKLISNLSYILVKKFHY